MASRLSIKPGVFKKTNNQFWFPLVRRSRSGGRNFSAWLASQSRPNPHPPLVLSTSFLWSRKCIPSMMATVVFPRLGMNAELEAVGQARLIIPTSLRSDYLTVLETLTVNGNSDPFISFAHKLIEMNSHMPFGTFEQSLAYFRKRRSAWMSHRRASDSCLPCWRPNHKS